MVRGWPRRSRPARQSLSSLDSDSVWEVDTNDRVEDRTPKRKWDSRSGASYDGSDNGHLKISRHDSDSNGNTGGNTEQPQVVVEMDVPSPREENDAPLTAVALRHHSHTRGGGASHGPAASGDS